MIINTVLIIDDDPHIRRMAQIGLEDLGGWQVIHASNGMDGITIAQAKAPDLILLDVMMPEMDGIVTLSKLRQVQTLSRVPVIFMTASAQSNEGDQYLSLGAIGLIAKPFDPMTLSKQVSAIVNHSLNRA